MLADLPDLLRHHSSITRPAAFAAWAENHHRFAELFRRFRSSRPASLIKHLPAEIRIFRGQDAGDAFGLAWTADRAVAEGFAHGHRGIRHNALFVYEITVQREEVAFVCDDREEAEIVLLSITPAMVRQAIENAAESPGFYGRLPFGNEGAPQTAGGFGGDF